MNEQNSQNLNMLNQNLKCNWSTFLSIFFVVLLIGVGIYCWQQSNLDNTKNNLEHQITDLQNQIVILESTLESETSSLVNTKKSDINNEAICYNGRNQTIGTGCYDNEGSPYFKENFNDELADTFFRYYNEEKGITFNIPYNNAWGNTNCAVKPYIEFEEYSTIHFGKPWPGEGYSDFALKFKTPQNAEEIIQREVSNCEGFNKITGEEYVTCYPNAKKITIDNLTAVTWDDAGMGLYKHIEIIGKKYNYDFYTIDNLENELIDVIKTVELIN